MDDIAVLILEVAFVLQCLLFVTILFEIRNTNRKVDKLMATQKEQTAKLNVIGDKLDKATAEIVSAIKALKDAQANSGNTTPEEDAATARLEAGAQSLDDIVPDAEPPPPTS